MGLAGGALRAHASRYDSRLVFPNAYATMSRRIARRRSPIHGNGVFAVVDIPKGTEVIEYRGEVMTHAQIDRKYAKVPDNGHTFLFTLNDRYVIDANTGGNVARWINHSCRPNCEPYEDDDCRVFIAAKRTIRAGEELSYDYKLNVPGRRTARLLADYACRCGSPRCRGTMIDLKKKRR
jgi:SET domain-containing protein